MSSRATTRLGWIQLMNLTLHSTPTTIYFVTKLSPSNWLTRETYQGMVNMLFKDMLGRNVEDYVNEREFIANLKEPKCVEEIKSLMCHREVKFLNGRFAIFKCCLSKASDRALPFFQIL